MRYIRRRSWPKLVSLGTNGLVALVAVLMVPYALAAGSAWGTPFGGLLIQLLWLSFLPLASIPWSVIRADKLAAARKETASWMLFTPVIVLLIVGPTLALLTKIIGTMILGR